MVLATIAGALMGSAWAAIAGVLKAYRGAHEVISTIMLNWIAIFGGQWLFGLGGPLQDAQRRAGLAHAAALGDVQTRSGASSPAERHGRDLHRARRRRRLLADPSRTTLGYEVRAVGLNPEAARYGGVSVKRSIVLSMAIAGAFAGLAGAADVLGSGSFQIQTTNLQVVDARLHRHRRRAARPQHAARHRARRAALRRAPHRREQHLERTLARARDQPRDDHPGRDHPVRRRRDRSCAGSSRGGRRAADEPTPAPTHLPAPTPETPV